MTSNDEQFIIWIKNREKDVNMDYMGQEPLTYLYLLLQDTVNKKRNETKSY